MGIATVRFGAKDAKEKNKVGTLTSVTNLLFHVKSSVAYMYP